MIRRIFLVFASALLLSPAAHAEMGDSDEDYFFGNGFLAIEGGYWLLTGHSTADNAYIGYLDIGLSLSREFGLEDDAEAWRIGPKIGFGGGKPKGTSNYDVFYDVLLKMRYAPGRPTWVVRPYVDFGPGVVTYIETCFELETGVGVDFRFARGSAGFGIEYKEVFANRAFNRGITFLGSLGFHF